MKLADIKNKLQQTAIFEAEYEGNDIWPNIEEGYQDLLKSYPQLDHCPQYLEFLRLTGGCHVHNQRFSLGIYGFGGYVVTAFDEGLFLDSERFFRFGEILYLSKPDEEFALAFDFGAKDEAVLMSAIDGSEYTPLSPSFASFLESLA